MLLTKNSSSTITEVVLRHSQSELLVACAYFYFDFNDTKKQRHENLIRSLIDQLSLQSGKISPPLEALFAESQNSRHQPTLASLLSTLQQILGDFRQTYIIIDALDECMEREDLLIMIETIVDWKLDKLHILATSRRERDIEDALGTLVTTQICIQDAVVNADIQTHIRERLANDSKLKRWPTKVQIEIETALMDGAHGM
jgi:hypothetical protein